MVVGDFDIVGIPLLPSEADSPALVDADAVLPLAIPFEGLQPIPWRDPQVLQHPGPVQVEQFPAGLALEGAKPRDRQVVKQGLGLPVLEGPDHTARVFRNAEYVKHILFVIRAWMFPVITRENPHVLDIPVERAGSWGTVKGVAARSPICADESLFRQELVAAGHRAGEVAGN
jgi:hypothetical protein